MCSLFGKLLIFAYTKSMQPEPTEQVQDIQTALIAPNSIESPGALVVPAPGVSEVVPTFNPVWAKNINIANGICIVTALFMLGFADFPLAISSWSALSGFFMLMLIAFGVLIAAALFEFVISRALRSCPKNGKDTFMLVLVCLRNGIIFLNVIPFIQLIGLLLGVFIAPIIIFLQIVILIMRYIEYREFRSLDTTGVNA